MASYGHTTWTNHADTVPVRTWGKSEELAAWRSVVLLLRFNVEKVFNVFLHPVVGSGNSP